MKFTLSWLHEHLDTTADLETITDKLTAIGLELEGVEDPAVALAPFVVGYVKSAEPHPNADKLQVCVVDTGDGISQVVCGAPNARVGMKGVFAPEGSTVPGTGPGNEMKLKRATIRGVESRGMLCSEREMGLSDAHTGIIELPDDAPVGKPFAQVMGLDDPVIDIAITPNRQDCLGVYGIARDLAAALPATLKPLDMTPVPGTFSSPVEVRLDFADADSDACPHFVGRYIRGVKNGPSPQRVQDRLRAVGLRPISALVDVTNLLTLDRARPLHVFDADKLTGAIVPRLARAGESLDALDDGTYQLAPEMTVIADEARALALAGVIGGTYSGCTEETVNVFVESAWFDPIRTASTGRKLGIESDARYRFERGVDPEGAVSGIEAATKLILEFCGGEPSELVVAGEATDWRKTVELRPARVRTLGGLDLGLAEITDILSNLGFATESVGDLLQVRIPSWRRDIDGEADLVEEVARIHGYDKIPSVSLERDTAVSRPARSLAQRRVANARRALAARGLNEAVTWSFLPQDQAALFGGDRPELVLVNPISADLDAMRPSVLPNLITAAGRNVDRGFADTGLFEIGPQYADDTQGGQAMVAAGVRRGDFTTRNWAGDARSVDAFDAKADALAALAECGAPVANLQVSTPGPDWYHPGRSGVLTLGPKNRLAAFGEIHPRVLQALDVTGPLVGFEVYLDAVPPAKAKRSKNRPPYNVSDLPAVERDFAFLVDNSVPANALVRAAQGADKALIAGVGVFDLYEGKGIPDGQKSVAIMVRLQPVEKTLTDEEIERVSAKVVGAVGKATDATLR
jgi:phenylalanyl-tRNA synthetase beta chain